MEMLGGVIEDYKYQYNKLYAGINKKFHVHAKHEIYYFHSGNCQYMIGGDTISLLPGDLIVMNGMREHGPLVHTGTEYVRSTILFDGATLQPYLSEQRMVDMLRPFRHSTYMHWRLDGEAKLEMEELLSRMQRFYIRSDRLAYQRLRLAFFDLLLFVNERHQSTNTLQNNELSEKELMVQKVIFYVEQHYDEDLTMDIVAKAIALSRYYLMHIFKELVGMTVFEYLNLRRINQAKILLQIGEYKVSEVCYKVGFKHTSHFSRNFKKVIGISPEEYRRIKNTSE